MKRKLIFIIAILFIIFLGKDYIKEKLTTPYHKIIYLNWKISVPKEYKEIYSIDSGPSFHGDGERYHIFQYKTEEGISAFISWDDYKNRELEKKVKDILYSLEVPKDRKPNFQKHYYYYTTKKIDNSNIYLLFFRDTKELYIIEDIF